MREQYLQYLQDHTAEILEDLKTLVQVESPTYNRAKVDACTETLKAIVKNRLGLEPLHVYDGGKFANHLLYECGTGEDTLLCIGHYDTVWETNPPKWGQVGNELHGPGIYDMKSGVISAIWAMKACRDLHIDLGAKVWLFFNSDEETGSPDSRYRIMELAPSCKGCFVLEPASSNGSVVTGRKGCCEYVVTVHGKSAHAGECHADGINAIQELANQVQYIHSLTDYEKGTTFNVGVCASGERACVVPDLATFTVNCRYTTVAEAQRVDQIFANLQPILKGTTLEISCDEARKRMPMEESDSIMALYETIRREGKALGFDVPRVYSGGTSDANDVAAQGVPVLDGMGAVGEGAHSANECIYLDQYIPRIALLISGLLNL